MAAAKNPNHSHDDTTSLSDKGVARRQRPINVKLKAALTVKNGGGLGIFIV